MMAKFSSLLVLGLSLIAGIGKKLYSVKLVSMNALT